MRSHVWFAAEAKQRKECLKGCQNKVHVSLIEVPSYIEDGNFNRLDILGNLNELLLVRYMNLGLSIFQIFFSLSRIVPKDVKEINSDILNIFL